MKLSRIVGIAIISVGSGQLQLSPLYQFEKKTRQILNDTTHPLNIWRTNVPPLRALNLRLEGPTGRTKQVPGYGGGGGR